MSDDQDERRAAPLEDVSAERPSTSAPAKKKAPSERVGDSPRENFLRESQSRGVEGDDEAETELWEGGYSPKAMVGTWVLCAILSIAAIVATVMFPELPWLATLAAIVLLWVIVAAVYAARRLGVHYQLTTQRFIHRAGILSRRTDRIEVIDINDVSYEQGPVQRMFGIGSIRIDSSDRSHPVLTMKGISDVHRVAGLIDDIRRKERRRRSLHIESI